jgi:hypothetical protein
MSEPTGGFRAEKIAWFDGVNNPDGTRKYFSKEDIKAMKTHEREVARAEKKVEKERRRAPAGMRVAAPGGTGEGVRPEAEAEKSLRAKEADMPLNMKNYMGVRAKSIAEIRENPQLNQAYGELMATLDPNSADILARAYAGGDLTDRESRLILYSQYEVSKYTQMWEKISNGLKPEDLELIMKRDEAIHQGVMYDGPAASLEVWKQDLLHLAMTDREHFDAAFNAEEGLGKKRGTRRYKNFAGEMESIAKDAKMDFKDYDAMFDLRTMKGRLESKARLRAHIRKDLTGFSKITGALGLTSLKADSLYRRARNLDSKLKDRWESPTSWVMRDINEHLGTLARVAKLTYGDKEKMKLLRAAAFQGKPMEFTEEAGPKSVSAMKTNYDTAKNGPLSDAGLKSVWDRDKVKAEYKGKKWPAMNTAERTEWRDNVWQPQELKQKGKGMFAQILTAFISWLMADRKKSLSVEG